MVRFTYRGVLVVSEAGVDGRRLRVAVVDPDGYRVDCSGEDGWTSDLPECFVPPGAAGVLPASYGATKASEPDALVQSGSVPGSDTRDEPAWTGAVSRWFGASGAGRSVFRRIVGLRRSWVGLSWSHCLRRLVCSRRPA